MKKITSYFLLVTFAVCLLACTRNIASKSQTPFRIVGYYPLQAAMNEPFDSVPFDKLTHINLWFLNPDSTGVFTQDFTRLAPFVQAAHSKGVKVLASIAGGSPHPYYHELLKNNRRAAFINDLVNIARNNNLDGIDVDIEGHDIDENYEAFATGLAAALRAQNKMITAAIAVYYKDSLTDKALAQYDFVNIMSYDRTGSWNPAKPGPHALYEHAVEDLEYFGVQRSIPKEKLVLGVPFYGYGFGPQLTSPAISMNYKDIVARFPGAEAVDAYKMPDGKTLYYNGIPTIKQKTALAKAKASGIMIWQLRGDTTGKLSLLQAINDAVKE